MLLRYHAKLGRRSAQLKAAKANIMAEDSAIRIAGDSFNMEHLHPKALSFLLARVNF